MDDDEYSSPLFIPFNKGSSWRANWAQACPYGKLAKVSIIFMISFEFDSMGAIKNGSFHCLPFYEHDYDLCSGNPLVQDGSSSFRCSVLLFVVLPPILQRFDCDSISVVQRISFK